MKKYGKIILLAAALVVLLAGGGFLYQKLASKYKPNGLVEKNPTQSTSVDEDEVTGGAEESEDAQTIQTDEGEQTAEYTIENTESAEEQQEDEEAAPDFTVVNGADEEVKLSDFQGKPVILNFWASWCGPCKGEMPDFQELYEEYGEDIYFVMVNLTDGSRETKDTAQAFIDDEGYSFPVYFDTEQTAAYAYYVTSIPATYFIDSEGYLVAYGRGAMDRETILQGIGMFGELN